ncbi:hypothetical protein GH714_030859 [Hevea brasiliensis]|uniref:Leucine-rich repeat-containing N-terminal plant-type domain-containing protein n=1 Tax=Hevea brasiliensis TaxID=3981 RepID=A0A6A6N8A7_HEVBR|nr:hypothetical protein GH714_030859 [Hevea brasiliensis]
MGLNDSWNRLSSWHGTNCCQWSGIACHNTTGAVLAVDLPNSSGRQPLGGEIRPSLAKLKSLKHLDLSGNNFTGKIPHFLSSLENLQYLNLSYAGFRGAIPPNLGNLSSLQFLDVSYWGSTVDNLEWDSIGFGELPNLESLMLNYNLKLSASCFQLFSRSWKKIQVLDLSITELHGRLPALLGNMTSLIHFDLHFNHIEGGIPSSIGKLSNLQYIDLSLNNLTGSLPDSIGQLKNLVELRLNNNLLQGSIPSSLETYSV